MSIARYRSMSQPSRAAGGVAILSDDPSYRAEVMAALRQEGLSVSEARLDVASLSRLEGWHAPWRSLADLASVVLDITSDPERGLAVLDALRRRDWQVPVILLVRAFGRLPAARIGANLVLEGHVQPAELAATVTSLVHDRERDDLAATTVRRRHLG